MSKTTEDFIADFQDSLEAPNLLEALEDFHSQLLAVGKYNGIDFPQFSIEFADLFNKKFLLDPLFKFSKSELDKKEQEKINLIYEKALWLGDIPNAKIALKLGAEAHYSEEDEYSPLHHAAKKGDVNMLKFLAIEQKWDINRASFLHGWSPIGYAVYRDDLATVKILEELGASLDQAPTPLTLPFACNTTCSPIEYAARAVIGSDGQNGEVLKYFISKGIKFKDNPMLKKGWNDPIRAVVEKAEAEFQSSQVAAKAESAAAATSEHDDTVIAGDLAPESDF